ncbi:MAG: hypothetical protein KDB27_06605, partial [Planctomycetales bacterium]|nr:hypothetical protein [Planctomycetales bacterium]
ASWKLTPLMTNSDTTSRAASYDFLGRLWVTEIDRELFNKFVQNSDLRSAFTDAGGDLSEIQAGTVDVDELAEDYCQLFLGPTNHLPP